MTGLLTVSWSVKVTALLGERAFGKPRDNVSALLQEPTFGSADLGWSGTQSLQLDGLDALPAVDGLPRPVRPTRTGDTHALQAARPYVCATSADPA